MSLILPSNLNLPVLAEIDLSNWTMPTEFFYITHKFGGYHPTQNKAEGMLFDTPGEIAEVIKLMNFQLGTNYSLFLYANVNNEESQEFAHKLTKLADL